MFESEIKYQIFVSSTYEDLKGERESIVESILRQRHFPVGMEMFGARSQSQWQVIKSTIDSSDFYILVIGHRYGSEDKSEKPFISYTEKEFNYAYTKMKTTHMQVLCFIRHRNHVQLDPTQIESSATKTKKLNKFINKVKNAGLTVDFWQTKDDLAGKVWGAISNGITDFNINNNETAGWIKRELSQLMLKSAPKSAGNPLTTHLPNIKKLIESFTLMFEIVNDDTEVYEFNDNGDCTIAKDRVQLCKTDVTHSIQQYIPDKKGKSEILEVVNMNTGNRLDIVDMSDSTLGLKFLILFGNLIKAGRQISYKQTVFVENFISNLIDRKYGTVKYSSFPKTTFSNKTDVFIFPNSEIFKNLTVNLKQVYPGEHLHKEISYNLINNKRVYTIEHGTINAGNEVIVEFKRL